MADDEGGTEPVPERVYAIPSAWDSHEAANDDRCRQLVAAVSSTDDRTPLAELLSTSQDSQLWPALGRALASSIHASFGASRGVETDVSIQAMCRCL